MSETDWKAHARKWENRCMQDQEKIKQLEAQLAQERVKVRTWRDAFHALRDTLEDRLDRLNNLLDTEPNNTRRNP